MKKRNEGQRSDTFIALTPKDRIILGQICVFELLKTTFSSVKSVKVTWIIKKKVKREAQTQVKVKQMKVEILAFLVATFLLPT